MTSLPELNVAACTREELEKVVATQHARLVELIESTAAVDTVLAELTQEQQQWFYDAVRKIRAEKPA